VIMSGIVLDSHDFGGGGGGRPGCSSIKLLRGGGQIYRHYSSWFIFGLLNVHLSLFCC
jgi:hypothetical protein